MTEKEKTTLLENIERNVTEVIEYYNPHFDPVNLEKDVSYYVADGRKRYFNQKVAKRFNFSTKLKNQFISKMFSTITTGEDLVKYIKEESL